MKLVLINPAWIHDIDWKQNSIRVDLSRLMVMNAPSAVKKERITRDFERQLFRYYGFRPYW